MNSLLTKLDEVIESINHDIDSSHNLLFQIYHIDPSTIDKSMSMEEKGNQFEPETFITYEYNDAMDHYLKVIDKRHPTSMLCNGNVLQQYGDKNVYDICSSEAKEDYKTIYSNLHTDKLNKSEILHKWPTKYDQKWILSVKREAFVATLTNDFDVSTIQIAMKLYRKLIKAIKYDSFEQDDEDKLKIDNKIKYNDIMFLWTKKDMNKIENIESDSVKSSEAKPAIISTVKSLDDIHFLYIVSVILDELKTDLNEIDIRSMLICLHKIKMNGLLFSQIQRDVFKYSVVIHSHSFKEVNLSALVELVQCTDKLYDAINGFDLESIQPSSICSISMSESSTLSIGHTHTGNNSHDQDDEKTSAPKLEHAKNMKLDIFSQWMITFDSQYNRDTPFALEMFAPLLKIYNNKPNVIIKIKYDNYSTDVNEKTYDDVLKSFIAWAITLKCSNLRCGERPKLNCFCDTDTFQLYTFKIIMGIVELKANNNYSVLIKLSNPNNSVPFIVNEFCDILPNELTEKKYYKSYKSFIMEWINFEFYNFRCEYCYHINKTVMIDRIYQYSKSMDSCRICNKRQISRVQNNQPQFNMREAVSHKNLKIDAAPHEPDSEFSLHSLKEYLTTCHVNQDDLKKFQKHLNDEEYDSDAVMNDIMEGSEKQSNIYHHIASVSTKKTNYYHFIQKYLNYDQYPTYKQGKLIRYLALKPKYFSLSKEICLNDIRPLSINDWDVILTEALKQYKKDSMFSNVSDKRFGIEKQEPIGIQHLIALYLFTDDRFAFYRRYFGKSYWLWEQKIHCNNFYWIGRYLFEAVQFYGDKFDNKLICGLNPIKVFDSMAPVFNSPTLTTDDINIARGFAGKEGCTLSLRPKYVGDIDNSKLLNTKLFNKTIRLLKGTKIQLTSIRIVSPPQNLDDIVLAMQYIEKILLQTEFDVHFYNSEGLYTPQNMKVAYLLIMGKIGEKPSSLIPFSHHLFDNWCFQRDFVTFETFKLEMNYMDYKLKTFLFDENRNKINITNVMKFLPNLKHYHDINGILREVDKDELKIDTTAGFSQTDDKKFSILGFGLLYNCQSHDIPYHIVNALDDIHFKFDKCTGVLREAFRMKLSKLDINLESFYENSKYFTQQLISIGISEDVTAGIIKETKKKNIHSRTKTEQFITFILDLMESQYYVEDGVKCDSFTQKESFRKLYAGELKKFRKAVEQRDKVTIDGLYQIAVGISIFDDEIATKLSKYLYIKIMDDKEKIVPWTCKTCQFLNCKLMVNGLWRYYNEGNKCGMCGDPRYEIANKVNNEESQKRLSIQRRSTMGFIYNKYKSTSKINQPKITEEWNNIDFVSECTLFKSLKHLSSQQLIYLLENYFFVKIMESEKIKKKDKDLLSHYKENIIAYFKENKINGTGFMNTKRMDFPKSIKAHCNNDKLHVPSLRLHKIMCECDLTKITDIPNADDMKDNLYSYNDFISDCPAYQKVTMVLEHFEQITNDYDNKGYPYKMNLYLSLFPGYSPVEFLNDIDHIIRHKLKHLQTCKKGEKCIHIKRALRDRNTKQCKTLALKKQFFNTNNEIDFVYISMLDRAHCLLKHSDDIEKKSMKQSLSDDVTKMEHLPYSTGTYMEYHTLKPLHQNLFNEIVRNRKNEVTEEQFNSELEASKLFLKTDNVVNDWRAWKTDKKYGIKVNEPMHIEHVLCIKFYCNYSALCEKFRRSYRKNTVEDTNDDIIRKHCNNHYWFGRFLTTAIEFWGKTPKTSDFFYHGLKRKFVFHHFSTVYEIPTSTTWVLSVAQTFSDAEGIVLKLSPKYSNEVNNSRCLDVSGLSDFKSEKEKLFAGMTVLSITNIYNPSHNKWAGYPDYVSSFLYFERIIEQTIHQKQHYNFGKVTEKTKKKWMQRQRKYLVPLLKHQMNRNSKHKLDIMNDNDSKQKQKQIPSYICVLFEFFCDNKRDHIDLSCINDEISLMDESLRQILFQHVEFDKDSKNLTGYKINGKNLKLIFPNLVEYKNHLGHWIYVGSN